MNLILFGFKNSGKTFWGNKIAAAKAFAFKDLDTEILETFSNYHSCRDLFLAMGEKSFRRIERQVLFSLKGIDNTILSLGGGTLIDKENLEFAKRLGDLIFINPSKETLKRRLFEQSQFPAFLDAENKEESFEVNYRLRMETYRKIPAFVFNPEKEEDIRSFEEKYGIELIWNTI